MYHISQVLGLILNTSRDHGLDTIATLLTQHHFLPLTDPLHSFNTWHRPSANGLPGLYSGGGFNSLVGELDGC